MIVSNLSTYVLKQLIKNKFVAEDWLGGISEND